ncbi:hypothetical protein BDK51DRAFT_47146 [Blyttiomyces helicus]|uniref:Uncharacterized protein n=1 Tax=Blyttiomyces helicus TaxID=388810 RepID=A0A4P9W4K3_9FUNG|nr:hypothetical protein BDK51DRAFT_47146 [Blyttiomyces helicus]|eukprot:RKO86213.1 hypothetical protein BDK51DRAFT_47146 [Blyttiomyces helicus]
MAAIAPTTSPQLGVSGSTQETRPHCPLTPGSSPSNAPTAATPQPCVSVCVASNTLPINSSIPVSFWLGGLNPATEPLSSLALSIYPGPPPQQTLENPCTLPDPPLLTLYPLNIPSASSVFDVLIPLSPAINNASVAGQAVFLTLHPVNASGVLNPVCFVGSVNLIIGEWKVG